jgi:ABC-type glycerol-3-phosphate transport system permease component
MFWIVVALIVLIAVFPVLLRGAVEPRDGTALFRPNLLPAEVTAQNYETVLGAQASCAPSPTRSSSRRPR